MGQSKSKHMELNSIALMDENSDIVTNELLPSEKALPVSLTSENGHVDLSGRNLAAIPEDVWDIEALISLNLSNNALSIIPESIAILQTLENLNLRLNRIIEFPDSFTTLQNLSTLSLSRNRIDTARIIPKLPESLHTLKLNYCGISSLDGIERLTNLRTLDISRNRIMFNCSKLKSLAQLETLRARSVNLDTLEGIELFTNLKHLDVSSNYNLRNIPSEVSKLKKLVSLDVSYCYVSSLPRELEELEDFCDLSMSWCCHFDYRFVCKMFLSVEKEESFTMYDFFPSLDNDTMKREELHNVLLPATKLGFLSKLTNIKLTTRSRDPDLLTLSRQTPQDVWEVYCNKIKYTSTEEFQFAEWQNHSMIFTNNVFCLIPKVYTSLLNITTAQDELVPTTSLNPFDIVSFIYNVGKHWIIDVEGNIWFCRQPGASEPRLQNNFTKIENIPSITRIVECDEYWGVWLLDINHNVWGCRKQLSKEHPSFEKLKVPPATYIQTCKTLILCIDVEKNVWDMEANENLTQKYQLPPALSVLPVAYPLSESYSYYVLDIEGNVWAKGFNTDGILGVGNTHDWIGEFKKVSIEGKVTFMSQGYNAVFFITENEDVYFSGSVSLRQLAPTCKLQRSSPVNTGLSIRRKCYQKSARK